MVEEVVFHFGFSKSSKPRLTKRFIARDAFIFEVAHNSSPCWFGGAVLTSAPTTATVREASV
jgi:hypothetical protein